MIWTGACACTGEMRNTYEYKTVVGKPEGKRLLRRIILIWILEK
jgi:hypothetical protein